MHGLVDAIGKLRAESSAGGVAPEVAPAPAVAVARPAKPAANRRSWALGVATCVVAFVGVASWLWLGRPKPVETLGSLTPSVAPVVPSRPVEAESELAAPPSAPPAAVAIPPAPVQPVPRLLTLRVAADAAREGATARWSDLWAEPLDDQWVDLLSLPGSNGLIVTAVPPGAAAARAGVRPGDVVLRFNDARVDRLDDYARAVALSSPAQAFTVDVVRPFAEDGAALAWFRERASAGVVLAAYVMAEQSAAAENYEAARDLYARAADAGVAGAQFSLGELARHGKAVPLDYQQAMNWYLKAANQGYAPALRSIGELYQNGLGVAQDYRQALVWFQKAAEKGDASATYEIGWLYDNGEGVAQDYKQAAAWYRKAADLGNAGGQNGLGWVYFNGKGAPVDLKQALVWYRKAADQGDAEGQNNVGWMYENGKGVAQDYRQAMAWYRKSAEQGYVEAQYNLAALYENGFGVRKDAAQAIAWYQKAADQGSDDAKEALDRLSGKGGAKPAARKGPKR